MMGYRRFPRPEEEDFTYSRNEVIGMCAWIAQGLPLPQFPVHTLDPVDVLDPE